LLHNKSANRRNPRTVTVSQMNSEVRVDKILVILASAAPAPNSAEWTLRATQMQVGR